MFIYILSFSIPSFISYTLPPSPPPLSSSFPSSSLCYVGYFSSNGFTPGCQACPIGTSTSGPGLSVCDICADGYYGRLGEPPCTACPASSTSNDKRTMCIQCIGYEPGCTQGEGGEGGGGDGSSNGLSQTNFSARLLLLEKKMKAQQSYIERYKKQRNQAEL